MASLEANAMAMVKKNQVRRVFESWRGVNHIEFKERLTREKTSFRMELESKMLVKWQTKVDSMLIYMAKLEDQIKAEQDAREILTVQYDQALTQGFNKLGGEAQVLS